MDIGDMENEEKASKVFPIPFSSSTRSKSDQNLYSRKNNSNHMKERRRSLSGRSEKSGMVATVGLRLLKAVGWKEPTVEECC